MARRVRDEIDEGIPIYCILSVFYHADKSCKKERLKDYGRWNNNALFLHKGITRYIYWTAKRRDSDATRVINSSLAKLTLMLEVNRTLGKAVLSWSE